MRSTTAYAVVNSRGILVCAESHFMREPPYFRQPLCVYRTKTQAQACAHENAGTTVVRVTIAERERAKSARRSATS